MLKNIILLLHLLLFEAVCLLFLEHTEIYPLIRLILQTATIINIILIVLLLVLIYDLTKLMIKERRLNKKQKNSGNNLTHV